MCANFDRDWIRMTSLLYICNKEIDQYAYFIQVNEKSDIYNFDMVILELVARKRLIDPEYEEKDLVKWVSTTLNEEEIDPIIDTNLGSYHKEEICKWEARLVGRQPFEVGRAVGGSHWWRETAVGGTTGARSGGGMGGIGGRVPLAVGGTIERGNGGGRHN
ncbi:hypothetical protein Syun_012737 [Stephania yunnanensis]|uniref:Uncharacterized protein n=1 Tax=Stephania yunnanensis TaxID=152371 RepID=A0AAP0K019_9MAGN